MKYEYTPNNLDLLRLILASSVVFLHLKHLSGNSDLHYWFGYLDWLSARAVPSFFIVSGFLIFMSFDKNTNVKDYARARVLRLYPAFFVLIVLCLLIGFVNADGRPDFWGGAIKYFAANLVFLNFLQPSLPYLFTENEVGVVNGALWTLKVEVMFYILVPFLYHIFKLFNQKIMLIFLFLSSVVYIFAISLIESKLEIALPAALGNQLPSFMHYFAFGIAMYLYYQFFLKYKFPLLLVSFLLVYFGLGYAEPVFIGMLILMLFISTHTFISFRKFGDISYGVYIFHFPIIQIVAATVGFDQDPFVKSAFVLSLTFVLAFASWHLLEKKMIRMKRKSS
jgi:peptidoglycan/LPS O-acetylase OafA/YrhL